jgi:hypothetical protein
MNFEFQTQGELFEWRGPAPYYFIKVDSESSALIKQRAQKHTYGWGVLHIHGIIGETEFQTALIPKAGIYYIPVKDAVRNSEVLQLDDLIEIQFNLGKMKG